MSALTRRAEGRIHSALGSTYAEASSRLDRAGTDLGGLPEYRWHAQLCHDLRDLCAQLARHHAALGRELADATPTEAPEQQERDRRLSSSPSWPAALAPGHSRDD